jgi:crotonobetainyl-CoA:carnitine CoA-transferase CaiB-like acyl-CoA transferase
VNPKLVYAQGTGLGERGPWAGRPVQDTIGMGHSGFLYTLSTTNEPVYIPGAISDVISGTYLFAGILAALRLSERSGASQYVECSQLQAMMWTQMMNVSMAANLGYTFPPFDRFHQFNPVFNLYEAGDGQWFVLSLIYERQWPVFCQVIGREDIASDPRFRTQLLRCEHSEELVRELSSLFKAAHRSHWLDLFAAHDLYVGQINRMEDLVQDEQVVSNGYLSVNGAGMSAPGPLFTLAGVTSSRGGAPALGEHNLDVPAWTHTHDGA